MDPTPYLMQLDTDALNGARKYLSDLEIEGRIKDAVSLALEDMAGNVCFDYREIARDGSLVIACDDANELWVTWTETCRRALVKHPYVEGRNVVRVKDVRLPTFGRPRTLARWDTVIDFLRSRHVNKAEATRTAAKIVELTQHARSAGALG